MVEGIGRRSDRLFMYDAKIQAGLTEVAGFMLWKVGMLRGRLRFSSGKWSKQGLMGRREKTL